MVYAQSTTDKLKAIAEQHRIAPNDVANLFEFDRQLTNNAGSLDAGLDWWGQNPQALDARLNQYNEANADSAITPGAAQRKQYLLIGAAVLVAVVLAVVAWKKFKK